MQMNENGKYGALQNYREQISRRMHWNHGEENDIFNLFDRRSCVTSTCSTNIYLSLAEMRRRWLFRNWFVYSAWLWGVRAHACTIETTQSRCKSTFEGSNVPKFRRTEPPDLRQSRSRRWPKFTLTFFNHFLCNSLPLLSLIYDNFH